MRKSNTILAGICLVALGCAGYEAYRARASELQLTAAKAEAAKQEKRSIAEDVRLQELQNQLNILQNKTDRMNALLDEFAALVAEAMKGAPGGVPTDFAQLLRPADAPPVPANQVAAERPLTPLKPEELASRIDMALKRTPEPLTPLTAEDLAKLPSTYEWGSGKDRRMMRLVDANTYLEVYPDGGYSIFPILGHAVVNDIPGVIATKDDGELEVFIPDKGGRMVHMLRGAGSTWADYQAMINVE